MRSRRTARRPGKRLFGDRRWAAAVLLGAVVLAFGCERKPPPRLHFTCRCAFLTDTDGESEQRVDVCAASEAEAPAAAAGCAQTAAPAPIQSCLCELAPGDCPSDGCKAHDQR